MHGQVHVFCGLLTVALASLNPSQAQDWPQRPVRSVVSTAVGTPPDVIMRLTGERLSTIYGQSFVVENVLGGGGLIASQQVARAAPDGYTYRVAGVGNIATDQYFFKSLGYNSQRDFVPVAILYDVSPFAMAVHPDVPAKSIQEIIQLAKSQPGKLSYGSNPAGVLQIPGLWFNKRAGIEVVAVPYKSDSTMVQDLVAGRIQLAYTTPAVLEPLRRAGRVRILAVTSAQRYAAWGDIPTIAETIPDYEVGGIAMLWAPTGTPPSIIQRLNRSIDQILKEPELVSRLLSIGIANSSGAGTAQSMAEFMRKTRANWAQIMSQMDIKPE